MDSTAETPRIYDKIASDYASKFDKPSEHIDDFIRLLRNGKKVLDLGCGPGTNALHLYKFGCKVTGTDFSPAMIKLAKSKVPEGIFKVEDMRQMDFPKNSFDGIFIAYSLIHISKNEVNDILNNVYKSLKKKGILYVAVQAGKSEEIFTTMPLDPKEKIFLNVVSKEEIKNVLQKAGFSITHEFERNIPKSSEFNFIKLFLLATK